VDFQPTYEVVLGAKESHLNFINTLPCAVNIKFNDSNSKDLTPLGHELFKQLEAGSYEVSVTGNGSECSSFTSLKTNFIAKPQEVSGINRHLAL